MTINIPILLDALEWATREHYKQEAGLPSEWDQNTWAHDLDSNRDQVSGREALASCGTACCLAGYVTMQHQDVRWDSRSYDWVINGEPVSSFSEEACALLGLDSPLGLFGGGNDIFDLWRISEELTDGAIEMPSKLQDEHATSVWEEAHSENAYRDKWPPAPARNSELIGQLSFVQLDTGSLAHALSLQSGLYITWGDHG